MDDESGDDDRDELRSGWGGESRQELWGWRKESGREMLGLHSAQLEQSCKMFHRNQTTPFTKVVFTDSQSDRQTTARMTIRGTCSIIQDAILPCSFSQSEASILLGRGTHYIIWISFFFFFWGGDKTLCWTVKHCFARCFVQFVLLATGTCCQTVTDLYS